MGSSSFSSTVTQDNRTAVTDGATGISHVSGSTTSLAPLSNLWTGGGNLDINLTDGGSVAEALGFAKSAMSQAIGLVIDQGKSAQSAASQIQDTAFSALQEAANKASDANTDNVMKMGKWLLIAAAVVGVAWYWKKGRK